ncbi:hypothetical protein AVEN_189171-1 [Araneus ventricosus]|uniref:Uncharacterized protein n=1 Tax=Araneus ventricosus TaxID=182803 RepID=A0A4Y2HMX5_ARAVE|nr:hypothetical protein AVEN_189171-1 [Araneus ventricosus]
MALFNVYVEELIPSPKLELSPTQSLDDTGTIKIPSPIQELKRRDYQLITLYKADDPSYEHCTIDDDEDDENSSCSSSEYFTCEEDNVSSTSSSDSEVRNYVFKRISRILLLAFSRIAILTLQTV